MSIKAQDSIISKSLFLAYLHEGGLPQQTSIKNPILAIQENIQNPSRQGYLSLELEDIPLVFQDSKNILVLSIEASTEKEAIENIIEFLSSKKKYIKLIREVLVHFTLNKGYDISYIPKYMDMIYNAIGEETNAAFGISTQKSSDSIKLSIFIGCTDEE